MDWALYYLSFRDRTEREVENYLDEKQFGEADIAAAVDRLKELGLIDDYKFASEFVRTRLASKAVSKRHLSEQLYAHHVPKEIIEQTLENISEDDELENAVTCAKKYLRQLERFPEEERAERVFSRLQRRGYSYDVARCAIENAKEEYDE